MNKNNIRTYYLNKRKELHNSETDQKISNELFKTNLYKNCSSIFITVSMGTEIATDLLIRKSLELGKKVFIPKTDLNKKEIIPTEIFSYPGHLIRGAYGIWEPKFFPETVQIPELTIVPGVVYSKEGYRIGYGGGFYDRFLSKHDTKTIGLSYDDLILDTIPVNSYG